jgi:hypothetical protein
MLWLAFLDKGMYISYVCGITRLNSLLQGTVGTRGLLVDTDSFACLKREALISIINGSRMPKGVLL